MSSDRSDSPGFPSEWTKDRLPSFGPDWDAAIAYGIDVSLLLENLARTPAERLAMLQQVNDFHEQLRNARKLDRE